MLSLGMTRINLKVNAPSLKALKIKQNTKRVFSSSFLYAKGSMTLEGTLVLPIFLYFIMTVMICLEVVRFQTNVMEALHLAGNRKAVHSHLEKYDNAPLENTTNQIIQYLIEKSAPFICIKQEQDGIYITDYSTINQNGLIQIEAQYQIKPWIYWLPIGDVIFRDHYSGHAFIGYLGTEEGSKKQIQDVYVFVTKSGSRYHINKNCTYLQIKAYAVLYEQLKQYRNNDGGKYYPCEKCHPVKKGQIFITSEGTCFHGKADCSAIKREIYMIPLCEAGKYTPCQKCSK